MIGLGHAEATQWRAGAVSLLLGQSVTADCSSGCRSGMLQHQACCLMLYGAAPRLGRPRGAAADADRSTQRLGCAARGVPGSGAARARAGIRLGWSGSMRGPPWAARMGMHGGGTRRAVRAWGAGGGAPRLQGCRAAVRDRERVHRAARVGFARGGLGVGAICKLPLVVLSSIQLNTTQYS